MRLFMFCLFVLVYSGYWSKVVMPELVN